MSFTQDAKCFVKRVVIFVFFLYPFAVFGKSELYAHLGVNMSHLQSKHGKMETAFSAGFTRDFCFKKAYLSYGLLVNNYKVNFYDKSFPVSLDFENTSTIVKSNLFINTFYFELPIKAGYIFPVLCDRFKIIPYAGFSISMLIKDKTKNEYINDYDIPFQDRKSIVYDFLITDEDKTRMVIGYNMGVDISCKRFCISFCYHNDLSKSKRFGIYKIEDAFSTFRTTLKYSLKTYSKDGGVS
jgi:hypothetical protein